MGPGVSALSDEEKRAENLRLEGNICFSKDRFQAAIDAYTAVRYFLYIFM
jgi:STIP1 family protein 1